MSCLVVIPARWGSTRLPGKPLIPVAGQPLLARVVALARAAIRSHPGTDLVVATDDERVAALAATLDCPAVMTPAALTTGSGRALAAAYAHPVTPSTIVNLQGDAPFVPPEAVSAVIAALADGATVATPVFRLSWQDLDALRLHKRASPFSGTTCVAATDGTASWFSKQIIPAIRDEARRRTANPLSPVRQHLGLYGYTLDALRRFDAAPPNQYEELEGLEQLRFLALGIPIRAVTIARPAITMGGIDTPEDIARAERLLRFAPPSAAP